MRSNNMTLFINSVRHNFITFLKKSDTFYVTVEKKETFVYVRFFII